MAVIPNSWARTKEYVPDHTVSCLKCNTSSLFTEVKSWGVAEGRKFNIKLQKDNCKLMVHTEAINAELERQLHIKDIGYN
jgi:hypothetical protein